MPDIPKIVPYRMRAASAQDALAATHPEADELTAFIEQALSPSERDGVLQHLALCADCREAVVLALPAMDETVLPAAVSLAEEDAEVALVQSSGADQQSGPQSREDGKQESEKERKSHFAWPSFAWTPLRWATLAAGIAVAVFVVRPALERINEKPNASINSAQNHAPVAAGSPGAESQIASSAAPENAVAEGSAKSPEQSPINSLATSKAESKLKSGPGEDLPSSDIVAGVAGVDRQVVAGQLTTLPLKKPSVPPSDPEMHLAGNLARVPAGKSSGENRSRSETVQVVAGGSLNETSPDSNTIAQNDAQSGAQNDEVIVQSAPAVVKSKPPLDDTVVNGPPVVNSPVVTPTVATPAVGAPPVNGRQNDRLQTTVPSPNGVQSNSAMAKKADAPEMIAGSQAEIVPSDKSAGAAFGRNTAASRAAIPKQAASWTITGGVLQRSVDGGQTWQAAARGDHSLLCYTSRGPEMWAGGEAGTLLHSSDSGATWSAVAVSYQGRSLDSAVTHIDVRGPAERGPAEIILSTGDHHIWSSADGGKTWEKK
ncbi:MAG: YCF48-related protein [Terriglobales bacterium]